MTDLQREVAGEAATPSRIINPGKEGERGCNECGVRMRLVSLISLREGPMSQSNTDTHQSKLNLFADWCVQEDLQ